MKVHIIQVDRCKPVLGTDAPENEFLHQHLEWQLVKCMVQNSQIQDRSEPTAFLGHNEVSAVKPWPHIGWRDQLYRIFHQKDCDFHMQATTFHMHANKILHPALLQGRGGGSGAVTISRWAVASISGLPISGPLASVLTTGFGGGLDGLDVLPATGSTMLPGERLLRLRGSRGGEGSARSVAARSSCWTARARLWPPSCRCFKALAWWICSNAMACRAEAAYPQAL